jgi:predicted DNA-binding transcriptional regulator AlpA
MESLITASEIARLLGLSRQRVAILVRRADFPESVGAVGQLRVRRVWRQAEVESWAALREIKSGRPRRG